MQVLITRNSSAMHASLAAHIGREVSDAQALPAAIAPDTVQGAVALNAEITRQAVMVAYNDDFRMLMLIGLLSIPLVLLIRPRKQQSDAEAARKVGEHTGQQRHHRAAEDGNIDDPRPVRCARPKAFAGQAEDRREHDRVHETDCEQAVAGHGSIGVDRNEDERDCAHRDGSQDLPRAQEPQESRAGEPSDHRAAPIIHDHVAGAALVETHDPGLHQIVHDQRADRHFGAYIEEDAHGAETEPRALQQRETGQR